MHVEIFIIYIFIIHTYIFTLVIPLWFNIWIPEAGIVDYGLTFASELSELVDTEKWDMALQATLMVYIF